MKGPKRSGRNKLGKWIAVGAAVAAGVTIILCAMVSWAVIRGLVSEKSIHYAAMTTLIISATIGCYVSFAGADNQKLVAALCTAAVYLVFEVMHTAILMKHEKIRILPLTAIILGCAGVSALIGTRKGRGNRKCGTRFMVKLNKKSYR